MSAMQPLFDRIQALRKMGGQAVDTLSHPGQAVHDMVMPQQPTHEQAIQQMNQQTNMHANDAANASFQPNLSTMKKPLGR